jgi:hypothetical protein
VWDFAVEQIQEEICWLQITMHFFLTWMKK